MIDYLIQNKDIFNISGIERRLNMPVDTLRKAISGDQSLPKKYRKPLDKFIINVNSDYNGVQDIIKRSVGFNLTKLI